MGSGDDFATGGELMFQQTTVNCPHCSGPVIVYADSYPRILHTSKPVVSGYWTHGSCGRVYCEACGNLAPPAIFCCGNYPACDKCGAHKWKAEGYIGVR